MPNEVRFYIEKRLVLRILITAALLAFAVIAFLIMAGAIPAYQLVCEVTQSGEKYCSNHFVASVAIVNIATFLDIHNWIVLAIATIAIAWFTLSLRDATAATVKKMEEAAKISADQTALLGIQADILEKQKEIARNQFFAEYRPMLVLKDVFFTSPDGFETLTFEIANIGGSEAKITGGFIALNFVNDQRRFKNSAEGDLENVSGAVFKAGELRQFSKSVSSRVSFNLRFRDAHLIQNLDAPEPPLGPLYFFGAILYIDGRGEEHGIERLSAFRRIWRYSGSGDGFHRTDDPDHEYAD